jgi:drug/metabolite transporter (DMT)-like permease
MTYSVKYVGSTATAVMGAMEPVTAVLVGLIAFSEQFTLSLATGIFLIIGAVTLIILTDRN